jgi:hypothetical protein
VAIVIESRGTEQDGADGASPAPFLAALVIIVLVVIGIGLVSFFNRGDDGEREAVVRAALAQNDALQRLDYPDFRASTCAQEAGSEAEVLARQRDSSASKGARYVDDVAGIAIDGQQAKATVVYYFAGDKDAKIENATTFVLQDGSWRVCSPGPG